MELTAEQKQIVASRATRLAVQAGAGAAKTTTLCAYAQARPRSSILYLAFNKAIQLEAAAKMPANVTCKTTHSIAWRKALQLFGNQAGQRVGNTYPSIVAKVFGCSALAATGALQTIQRWCGSLEAQIDVEHLPPEIAARLADPHALVTLAREVWTSMVDGSGREIRMPHDGYLKLFQMDRPVLRGFEVIAVDEAQDLNPCTSYIVRHQPAAVLTVGDSHQCLPRGTRVTLADGRIVPIEGIERGVLVRTAMGTGRFGSWSTRRT